MLSGDTADWQPKPSVRAEDPAPLSNEIFTVLFVIIAIFVIWSLIRSARGTPSGRYTRWRPHNLLAPRRCMGLVRMGGGFGEEEAGSAAAFRVAAVGRVVAARPAAGDGQMVEFTKEDYEVVSAAIREAEKQTSGQIVCVLAHSSSRYAYVPILWATVLALAVPWPLIDFTQWSVQRIFVLQLAVFILAGFLFSWMPLRLALVPRPIQRARALRAALEQFVVRRVTHTRTRSAFSSSSRWRSIMRGLLRTKELLRRCIRRNGKLRSIL